MIRFEILLPLFYNDGRPIEQLDIWITAHEIEII
jgi:hypothetical protein